MKVIFCLLQPIYCLPILCILRADSESANQSTFPIRGPSCTGKLVFAEIAMQAWGSVRLPVTMKKLYESPRLRLHETNSPRSSGPNHPLRLSRFGPLFHNCGTAGEVLRDQTGAGNGAGQGPSGNRPD